MTEKQLQNIIMLEIGGRKDTRLFRNTVGMGYQGSVVAKRGDTITLKNYRPVVYGLAPGSADLIGWHNGRFLSIEVKGPRTPVKDTQKDWETAVNEHGGIACIARSLDAVYHALEIR